MTMPVRRDEPADPIAFATVLAASVHDMKNSLSMVLGAMEELADQCAHHDEGHDGSSCPAAQGLRQLQYEGKRITSQLVRLLALYRIENEGYSLNPAEHLVHDCLEEVSVEHQALLALRGIRIDFDCADDLVWYFDRDLVGGIIGSVINNAYRYARARVSVSATLADGYLEISVADDGPGYPARMLVESSRSARSMSFVRDSSGLGLYFASVTAERHRHGERCGYISTSNDGIGAGGRFALFLP